MSSITLRLPVPPSTNNLFINVKHGGRVPSPKYRLWKQQAADTLWTQKRKKIEGQVSVRIVVPDKGRRDLDNFCKACLDFLVNHQFIATDDRHTLRKLEVSWADRNDCEVTVEQIA